jgi:ABC-2 type transport system permease protein
MALVMERREGTLLRLRVAPVSRMTILAGKAAGCFLACLLSVSAVLAIGIGGFGVRVLNAPALAVAVLCTCLAFVGIMMLISTLGRTEKAVGGGGWAILIVMMMFGGGMIPLIAMPTWMQSVSYFSPTRWAVLALEGAIWRDFTPMEMLTPCAILIAVGAAAFGLGLRRFRD